MTELLHRKEYMTRSIYIPADVPNAYHETFKENWDALTKNTEHMFLFSCDHKIEHLNDDFSYPHSPEEIRYPEHLFRIASQGTIGGMVVPPGLLTRHANRYRSINYVVKLTAKTNAQSSIKAPYSTPLWSVEDVLHFQKLTKIPIRGISFTIYLGSDHEAKMLTQSAHMIKNAHLFGLVAIAWIYIRGAEVEPSKMPSRVAGACGLAHALGADAVKIKTPENFENLSMEKQLRLGAAAAGNTAVLCAGGDTTDPQLFFNTLHTQLHTGRTRGCVVGRNIFQKNLPEAIAMTRGIYALVYENADAHSAYVLSQKK